MLSMRTMRKMLWKNRTGNMLSMRLRKRERRSCLREMQCTPASTGRGALLESNQEAQPRQKTILTAFSKLEHAKLALGIGIGIGIGT